MQCTTYDQRTGATPSIKSLHDAYGQYGVRCLKIPKLTQDSMLLAAAVASGLLIRVGTSDADVAISDIGHRVQ